MFNKLKDKFQEFLEEEKKLEAKPSLETKIKKKVKRKTTIKEKDIEEMLENLRLSLLASDVSLEVSDDIKEEIKDNLEGKEIKSNQSLTKITKNTIRKVLGKHLKEPDLYLDEEIKENKETDEPYIVLFLGPNGHGKTTTIAKTCKMLQDQGMEVVLAAADTFRAASIEQLEKWSKKLDVKLIKHDYGSDPAAVCYDAKKHAETKNKDVVLVDTAGRSELDKNLMQQLEKIKKVVNPNHTMYVTEAVAGNAAVEQAKKFNQKIGVDGFTVTKVDTDAKGGCLLSISSITEKPIYYMGTGQNLDDLKRFKKEWFINNILPE
ncbi:MAG: signal recognition particle-docking protein FtsY [archaeon]